MMRLETTTTATTLSASAVGGSGGDVLNSADLHASTSKGAESRLSTGSGGLGTVSTLFTLVEARFDGLFVLRWLGS